MDSQSVKNTDTADSKGYDAGKKVSGIKRHLAVDTQGLPHAIHITTANVTDRAGALAMFDRCRDGLSQVQNVLVDGGYTGKPFATAVQSLLGAAVEVVKRSEATAHLRGASKTMGGGAVFRLAGKVPPPLEELRKKAQYQPANGGARLHGANPKKIVNRLLVQSTATLDNSYVLECKRRFPGRFSVVCRVDVDNPAAGDTFGESTRSWGRDPAYSQFSPFIGK